MEIHIGVQGTPRELVMDVEMTEDELKKKLRDGLDSGVFELNEDKGRSVMIPSAALGYVEIASTETRRVGFGI